MQVPGRPVPTTFESIEAIALREPQRLALVQDRQSWTYHALYADLIRAVRVLAAQGVKRGDRVAVGTSGFQAGLLLLVACESLGAVTTSFLSQGDTDAQAVFSLVDWVFSDSEQEVPQSVRFVRIDEAFVARIRSVDLADPTPLPRVALGPGEPQRISRTSGSSGRSKFMVLRRHAQEYWLDTAVATSGLRPDSQLLILGPLVINGSFARASACLRIGAAAMSLQPHDVAAREVTHVAGLTTLIEELLEALPASYAPRRPVTVFTVGGFLTPMLRQKIARVFQGPVVSRYGMNEVCGVCDNMDVNGIGLVSAGVDIRIVDESGRDLPAGALGIVAVRTPAMVDGYIDDPDATQAAFREGWFYSGDWGTLVGHRLLRLAGRHDDLVNVGGIKIPANLMEQKVRELVAPDDCAVLATNLDGGNTTLGIALVMSPGEARQAVRQRLAEGLHAGTTAGARVLFFDELPRLPSGKIDRISLHRMFAAPPSGSV